MSNYNEHKTLQQSNIDFGETFKMAVKAPAVADRIFDTYEDADAYVKDLNSSACAGLVISVINDRADKNGLYYVNMDEDHSVDPQGNPILYLFKDSGNAETWPDFVDNNINIENTYVTAVHQSDGKSIPLHGSLEGSTTIDAQEKGYEWILIDNTFVPSNYNWDTTNTFSTLPIASYDKPPFIRVGNNENYTFYLLSNTGLQFEVKIFDDNNILCEEEGSNSSGLGTSINLRRFTPSEVLQLQESNVKEAYALFGSADGTEKQIGDIIKIYKSQSLYSVYVGHVDDEITSPINPTVIPGTGDTALCFIYAIAGTPSTYTLVAVDVEDFLQESEFGDGLSVSNHVVSVKLKTNGGLEYGPETNTNKSIKLKLDENSAYFTEVGSGEGSFSRVNIYEWTNGNNSVLTICSGTTPIDYRTFNHADYDYYTVNSSVVVSEYFGIFENNGWLEIDNVRYTSTKKIYSGFIEVANGNYDLLPYFALSADGLRFRKETMDENVCSVVENFFTVNNKHFTFDEVKKSFLLNLHGNEISVSNNGAPLIEVHNIDHIPMSGDAVGIYDYNGTIYVWDGTDTQVWRMTNSTSISESLSIFNYLLYNNNLSVF